MSSFALIELSTDNYGFLIGENQIPFTTANDIVGVASASGFIYATLDTTTRTTEYLTYVWHKEFTALDPVYIPAVETDGDKFVAIFLITDLAFAYAGQYLFVTVDTTGTNMKFFVMDWDTTSTDQGVDVRASKFRDGFMYFAGSTDQYSNALATYPGPFTAQQGFISRTDLLFTTGSKDVIVEVAQPAELIGYTSITFEAALFDPAHLSYCDPACGDFTLQSTNTPISLSYLDETAIAFAVPPQTQYVATSETYVADYDYLIADKTQEITYVLGSNDYTSLQITPVMKEDGTTCDWVDFQPDVVFTQDSIHAGLAASGTLSFTPATGIISIYSIDSLEIGGPY